MAGTMVITIEGGRYQTREEYVAESRRLQAAMAALDDATPNLRDYWPHEARWLADLEAHKARIEVLRQERAHLMEEFHRCKRIA